MCNIHPPNICSVLTVIKIFKKRTAVTKLQKQRTNIKLFFPKSFLIIPTKLKGVDFWLILKSSTNLKLLFQIYSPIFNL